VEHIKYTQEQFDLDVTKLIKQLEDDDFKPELIIGILRGGAIPAIHLSHILNCPVKVIEWSTRDSLIKDHKALDKIAIMAEHGMKVLIIDDIVDSGKTISEIKQRMFDTEDNIRYASLWYNPSQDTEVDFWCNSVNRATDERWVIFPWEKQIIGEE